MIYHTSGPHGAEEREEFVKKRGILTQKLKTMVCPARDRISPSAFTENARFFTRLRSTFLLILNLVVIRLGWR